MSSNSFVIRFLTQQRRILAIFLAWSATIGGLASWYRADHTNDMTEMAATYARACHDKDLIYRRWNSTHGGVYVPVSKDFQPNPYLKVAERDVTTPSGRVLTLVNPAYMTRQVHELTVNPGDIHAHITSLKPLNPSNGPDKWEEAALLDFEKGEKEASSIIYMGGKHTARLMRPLYVEQSCLKCHEEQGYALGDVRGGISVTVPVDSIWKAGTQQARNVFIALGGIWTLGAVTILLVGKTMNQRRLEREQAMAALAKKQAFLNTVLDNISDGIVACDADGVLTLFNPATRQFHGIPEMPIPAEQWPQHFDLYLPDGTTLMRKEDVPLYRVLQGDAVRNLEMVIAPKHGTPLRLLADGRQLIVNGELVGAVVVMHDITEQRQNEESLRKNEAMLSCILNSLPLSVFWKNHEGVYLGCNEKFAEGANRRPENVVGKTDFDLPWSREDTEAYRSDDREVMTSGRPKIHIIERQHRADGSCIWLDTTKIPLLDDHGKVYGVVGIYDDITGRKRAEEELVEAKQAAEAASRSKSEFLANMSHEIRTPMTAILGFADILMENSCDEETVESARIIKRNGQYLLTLINDILDLSKIEAGKCTVDLQKCSPSHIATEVISLMNVRAEAKGLPLTIEVRGDIPTTITTDPIRLRQILINLIGNSIKFTEVGGVRVVMRLDTAPDGDPKLIFDVIDTGIGMSEAQMGLLFRPFSQVDGSASRRFGGTGLGLAISKRMAEMLGGDILVRSSPGQGSTFSLSIGTGHLDGLEKTQEPGIAVTTKEPVYNTQHVLNCRILLAEDGPDNQRLIAFLLRKAGAEVELAGNGQIAVDLALAAQQVGSPFDIILMDMQMPVMDGYEATQNLRSAGYKEPIIALTAHAMTSDRQKCIDAGCNNYISKPIDPTKLVGLLEPWVARAVSVVPECPVGDLLQ